MKRSPASRLPVFLVVLLLLGCRDSSLAPSAATLDGTWARLDEIPGSSEVWTLHVNASSISGTGTWSGEACCAGTLTVSGAISNDSIHVDVSRVTTAGSNPSDVVVHEHFEGVLASRTLLRGMLTFENGSPQPARLQKR